MDGEECKCGVHWLSFVANYPLERPTEERDDGMNASDSKALVVPLFSQAKVLSPGIFLRRQKENVSCIITQLFNPFVSLWQNIRSYIVYNVSANKGSQNCVYRKVSNCLA